MRYIVFDIETANTFHDVGKNEPEALDISVVGIYDSMTDSYNSYLGHELGRLWPIMEQADSIVGFNSDYFDIPILNKYYSGDLKKIKSIDLMQEVRKVLGRRVSLANVAKATIGESKTGDGLQAITWWRNGEIEKLTKYCIQDVRITKKLYEYALKNGFLKIKDGLKEIKIPLETATWRSKSDESFTHTLPF